MLAMTSESSAVSSSDAASSAGTVAIETSVAGLREVPVSDILHFTSPVLGFEDFDRFAIFQTQAGPLWWLQSVDRKDVAFCLIEPFAAGIPADMEISGDEASDIGAISTDEILVLTMLVLDPDPSRIRTNLRAPILVNRRTSLAKQIVLADTRLPIRFHLKDLQKARPA